MKKWWILAIIMALSVIVMPNNTWAGGNIRPGGSLSPRALGMGGAHNAVSGDGAAFYHNVANLSQVPDFSEFDLDTIVTKAHFKEFGSNNEHESELGLFPMPMFALTHKLSDKLTLGLSLYPSDGLGVEYKSLKYQKSLLASINFTPAIAWQISDQLSVGIGLDVVYGQMTENAVFDQLGFPIDGVFLKNKASGWGLGYRLGLRYEPCDWLTFGVSYASKRKVAMDCQSDVTALGLDLGELRGKTSIGFPGRLGLGVAIKPADKWLVALDFDYYDYSGLDKIKFDFDWIAITQTMNWGNNTSLHLGVERTINENWKLRFGLAGLWPSVPKAKTVPIIPDGMGYCGSVGVGWNNRQGNLGIDVALMYGQISRETGPGRGVLAPGRNVVDVGIVSAGVTYYFGGKRN
ncbi:MAG: outer membrane protein transport protein [Candidatus Paceibacterota bacterium]|jgi:long-chain fatty acid transport protein